MIPLEDIYLPCKTPDGEKVFEGLRKTLSQLGGS